MKINFDQIFTSSPNQLAGSYASKISYYHTNHSLTSSIVVPQKQQRKVKHNFDHSKEKIMNTIQRHKKQQGNYKYYSQYRLDQTPKTLRSDTKPQPKVDVNSLTKRLTNDERKCKKQQCKEIKNTHYYKKIKQQNLPLNAPQKVTNKTLSETVQKLKKPSQVHNRLYRQYIQKQFRHHELKGSYEEERSIVPSNYENKEYLTNYTKFYDRLEDEVNRKMNKQKYYEANPNVTLKNQNHKLFKPDLSVSKKSLELLSLKPSIKPKLLKKQQTNRIKTQATYDLNNSFESVNKSVEIINSVQDKLVNKICTIFQDDGMFKLRPQNIQLLTETQFSIIFPLIQELQEKGKQLTIESFEQKFRRYYKKLPTKEKQQIRSHQIRRSKDTKAIRVQLSSDKLSSKLMKTGRTNKPKRQVDYLRKIQNFV